MYSINVDLKTAINENRLSFYNQTLLKEFADDNFHVVLKRDNSFTVKINYSNLVQGFILSWSFIFLWCLYLQFMSLKKRMKVVWVEVQDSFKSDYQITRNEAK